jgi:hypothetical protein
MEVKFEGIDSFNRPIFREVAGKYGKSSTRRFGCVNKLFDYDTPESEVLKEVSEKDLLFFGNKFGCEPMGSACDVTIKE